jgi:hypothetical protein
MLIHASFDTIFLGKLAASPMDSIFRFLEINILSQSFPSGQSECQFVLQ